MGNNEFQIQIDVGFDDNAVSKQLVELIKRLNSLSNSKVLLDVGFKDGNFTESLNQLNSLIEKSGLNFKNAFNGMNLGELQQAVKLTENLSDNLTKGQFKYNGANELKNTVETYKNGIAEIEKITMSANGNQISKMIEINPEKVEQAKSQLQSLVNTFKNSNFADISKVNQFNETIDNLKTDSSVKEVNQLKESIVEYSNQIQTATKIAESQPNINSKIDTFKNNGILNQSDISSVTNKASNIQTAQDLQAVNTQLSELKTKENNIVSIGKQLEKLGADADLLKTKYKGLVPDSEFNKLKADIITTTSELKKMDGTNFNGLKNQVNELRKTFDGLQNQAKSSGVQLSNQDSKSLIGYLTGSALKFSTWLGVGGLVISMVNKFKEGVSYIKSMDDAMTNVEMITGRTKDDVTGLMNSYKQLAGQMHSTNAEMAGGAEEFLRAGYDDNTVQAMLKASTIAGKISGQTNQDTAQQLIAIKNGFSMTQDQIMHVVDTLSTLDNASATSFRELSTAMQYVSFSAKDVGVSFEDLSSYIAVVSSKTRINAESIGQSFKTIFARYTDIKAGKTEDADGDPLSLNATESSLNKVGIAIRKDQNTFRDFGDVLNDLKGKWSSISQVDQESILKSLAGVRQKNILQSLLGNMDDLKNMQDAISQSAGSAEKKFDQVYGQSLDAKINDLKHSFETLMDSMMNSDAFKKILDGLTKAFNELANSPFLKEIGEAIANIVTWLAQMDSTGVVALGSLLIWFKALKTAVNLKTEFSAIATGLDVMNVKGGMLKQLFAILTGTATATKTVTKEIQVATLTTEAMSAVSKGTATAMATETIAVKGLSGAFAFLGNSIKASLISMVEFAMTPVGATIIALGAIIGIVTTTMMANKKAQEELNAKIEANVTSSKNLTQSMKELNSESIKENVKPLEDQQDNLQTNIRKRQEAIDKLKSMGISDYSNIQVPMTASGAVLATDKDTQEKIKLKSTIEALNKTINDETTALDKANIEYDKQTGAIKQVSEAKLTLKNIDTVQQIKDQAKAEMDNTALMEQHRQEYDKYLNTIQDAYSEYTKLNSIENLSVEQKQRLSQVVDVLSGKITGLKVVVDEDGRTRIENNGLIEKQIAMFQQEGVSVETLTSIRLADAKENSSIQVGTTQMTYSQIKQRIAYYQAEAKSIIESTSVIITALDAQQKAKAKMDNYGGMGGSGDDLDMARAEHMGIIKAHYAQNEVDNLQSLLAQLDSIYNNVGSGGMSAPSGGGTFTPSGDGSKDKKSSAKEVQDLEDLFNRYLDLNAVLKDVNSQIEINKSLQDNAHGQNAINLLNQEISLLNNKKTALENIYKEQLAEQKGLKDDLTKNGFVITDQGIIQNYYARIEAIRNSANALSGQAKEDAINRVKAIDDELKKFMDLTHDSINQSLQDIQSINDEIKKVENDKLSNYSDVEKQITDMVKKEVEERKKAIQEQADKEVDEINRAKEAYNRNNDQQDYDKNLNKEKQKLAEIQAQITNAQRDTSRAGQLRLQQLMDEAKQQQQAIDDMVLQHQRDMNNQQMDDQTKAIQDKAKADQDALDKKYSDAEIAKIVKSALSTGFIEDINGKMVSLKDFTLDYIQKFGDGMTGLGAKIETEFIDKLTKAEDTAKNLASILKDLGITDFKNIDTGAFKNTDLSNILGQINTIPVVSYTPSKVIETLTANINANVKNQPPMTLQMNQPFLVINGDVTKDALPDIEKKLDQVVDTIKNMKSQFQLQGLY